MPSDDQALFDTSNSAAEPCRPRILHVAGALAQDDPTTKACLDAVLATAEAGALCVVASASMNLVAPLQRAGVAHTPLPSDGLMPWRRPRVRRHLGQLLREINPHLVHAWGNDAIAWLEPLAASTRIPLLVGLYQTGDEDGYLASFAKRPPERGIVITDSAFARTRLMSDFDLCPSSVATVRPAVDRALFQVEHVTPRRLMSLAGQWRLPDDRLVVLIPDLYPCGGHFDCLEAIGRMQRRTVHTVIANTGPLGTPDRDRLEYWMARKGPNILVHCADETTDWPAALTLASVIVVPARSPFATLRPLLEAQAMGRPVVAVDAGGIPEVTLPGQTAALVPPGDPVALATAIIWALDMGPGERSMVAQRGQRFVATWFSRPAVGSDLFTLYGRLVPTLSRPQPPAPTRMDRTRSRIVVVRSSGLATTTL